MKYEIQNGKLSIYRVCMSHYFVSELSIVLYTRQRQMCNNLKGEGVICHLSFFHIVSESAYYTVLDCTAVRRYK